MSKAERYFNQWIGGYKGVNSRYFQQKARCYGDLRAEEMRQEKMRTHISMREQASQAKADAYRDKALELECTLRADSILNCAENCERTPGEYCLEVIKEIDSCLEVSND